MKFGRNRQLAMRDSTIYQKQLWRKSMLLWEFLPLGIGFSLLPISYLLTSNWWRFAMAVWLALLMVHSQLASSWTFPHYLAPAMAPLIAINVQCLRHWRLFLRDLGIGQVIARTFIILTIVKLVPIVCLTATQQPTPRQIIAEQLSGNDLKHLVIVSYDEDYPICSEWVYNDADIDSSKIVWARDCGHEKNAKLIEYYAERMHWRCRLENDDSKIEIQAIAQPQMESVLHSSSSGQRK